MKATHTKLGAQSNAARDETCGFFLSFSVALLRRGEVGVRADLARLYMRHRLDLGLALTTDEWIIEHVNDILAALWFLSARARPRRLGLAASSPLVADSGDPAQSRRGQQHARRLKMTPA